MISIPSRSTLHVAPLETPRTLLRPLTTGSEELWQVVQASRLHLSPWLPWVPFNDGPRSSQRYIEACIADWDNGKALRFGIYSKMDRSLIGSITLDNCIHLHRSCDLGYWLAEHASGKGLMTEVGATVVDFAHRRVGIQRIRCAAAVNNFRSLRVIARLGFRFEGVARRAEYLQSRWVDHAVFCHLSPQA